MTPRLADRIRQARERHGWNQSELARALGVSPQTVQQWEKGGGVRQDRLEELARALVVTPDWLLFGHGRFDDLRKSEVSGETRHASQIDGLDALTLRDTIAGLRWRYQLAGTEFAVEHELEVFALALSWAIDPTPVRQAALTAALEPRLHALANETPLHGSATTPHRRHRTANR